MTEKRTLEERQREMQTLLASSEGRQKLEELAHKYEADSGRPRPHGTSIITYLLVHERGQGMLRT